MFQGAPFSQGEEECQDGETPQEGDNQFVIVVLPEFAKFAVGEVGSEKGHEAHREK
jgi:hypothetical protein